MFHVRILFLICFTVGVCQADFCAIDGPGNELPQGYVKELATILTTGVLSKFFKCNPKLTVSSQNIHLFLYTRENPDSPLRLDYNDTNPIDLNKPIKILIAGWLCNVTNSVTMLLKDAYLQRYDCNVIGIDWTKYSVDLYSSSFCYIPLVAKVVAEFLCSLSTNPNEILGNVHIIGHSLGAQMSGFIGQEVQQKCSQTIGRITGLEPSGPLYQGLKKSRRLDKSDATFVDVIHSNQGMLGYYGACGHVDFYPNCGTFQKGCGTMSKNNSLGDITTFFNRYVLCHHLRSLEYMIESINSNKFIARSCRSCPKYSISGKCKPDKLNSSTEIMGEDCSHNPTHSSYILFTNSKSPFAKG